MCCILDRGICSIISNDEGSITMILWSYETKWTAPDFAQTWIFTSWTAPRLCTDVMAQSHWTEYHSVCFPYTKVVWFFKLAECRSECRSECVFPNVSPNAFRMFSVWFQNGPNISHMLTSKGFLSERFPTAFRTRRIDLEWTELFPHAI